MAVPVFLYDSFPARRFGGNVAGVVFLDSPAPRGWPQHIAAELAAPTTGFVDMPTARMRDARARLRVDMGIEMGRPSRLSVDLDFADGRPAVARLWGFADRVLTGEITAPA